MAFLEEYTMSMTLTMTSVQELRAYLKGERYKPNFDSYCLGMHIRKLEPNVIYIERGFHTSLYTTGLSTYRSLAMATCSLRLPLTDRTFNLKANDILKLTYHGDSSVEWFQLIILMQRYRILRSSTTDASRNLHH